HMRPGQMFNFLNILENRCHVLRNRLGMPHQLQLSGDQQQPMSPPQLSPQMATTPTSECGFQSLSLTSPVRDERMCYQWPVVESGAGTEAGSFAPQQQAPRQEGELNQYMYSNEDAPETETMDQDLHQKQQQQHQQQEGEEEENGNNLLVVGSSSVGSSYTTAPCYSMGLGMSTPATMVGGLMETNMSSGHHNRLWHVSAAPAAAMAIYASTS
ncbi:hypothetical protein BGW38_006626, partial [Lunasporangiospora selenospora]